MVNHRSTPPTPDPPAAAVEPLTRLLDRRLAAIELRLDRLTGELSRRRKDHLTVDEFADNVSRSAYTVRRWIAEGRIRAVRVQDGGPRGRLIVPRAELERVIAAGMGDAIPDAATIAPV